MKHTETGVLEQSVIEFTIPSEFAKKAMYCCPQAGYFFCDSRYDVRRETYDWFLMVYVCSGALLFESGGQSYAARSGEVVLLDCHIPHRYRCRDSAVFMWFHFYGSGSEDYAQYLYAQNTQGGIVFSGDQIQSLRPFFSDILQQAGSVFVNEHLLSRDVVSILSGLASSQKNTPHAIMKIAPAIDYVFAHFSEPIDLDQMAELCMLSKPHLIRCFKQYLDCTPHDYLLGYRLREAQKMLSDTLYSVEEIADRCGFNSVSHFSRAFRKQIGMTPSEFRNMWG